ncbi:aromatic ring-opening dioxygenase LigA [Streptomyces sp. NPDC024062]|uniref:aromatic ring-opening dioxygenase LigA n=1 Tax=unclassified Streptomyces TaxID=2593676 RepID=UPI0034400B5A
MTPRARLDQARQLLNTPPPPTVPGQLAVETTAAPDVCEHGNPQCEARPTRPYVQGPRCEEHRPAVTRPYFQPRRSQP